MSFFKKIGKSLTSPTELFQLARQETLWQTLKYQIKLLLIFIGIIGILFFVMMQLSILPFTTLLSSLSISAGAGLTGFSFIPWLIIMGFLSIFTLIGFPIVTFIGAGIIHLFVKLFKGQGSYLDTYKAAIYSQTPTILLSFIPIINMGVPIWSFIITLYGISTNHYISKTKAFFAIIAPIAILAALGGIISLISPSTDLNKTAPENNEIPSDLLQTTNFEITEETNCEDGIIDVYVKNPTNIKINTEDWTIHTINDKEIGFFAGDGNIEPGETHNLIWTVNEEDYQAGEHTIRLGIGNNIETYQVSC